MIHRMNFLFMCNLAFWALTGLVLSRCWFLNRATGVKEELVQGIRISCIYEAITHAVTCALVLCNEPSNISGQGIRQGSTIPTFCKIQSLACSKLDQSNAMLVRILHGAVLKRSCGKQH